jgi:hypothetical protein
MWIQRGRVQDDVVLEETVAESCEMKSSLRAEENNSPEVHDDAYDGASLSTSLSFIFWLLFTPSPSSRMEGMWCAVLVT